MSPPLMQRFQHDFNVVARLQPNMPQAYQWGLRLLSIRWPREAWYRRWRYLCEKTPFTFSLLTRQSARELGALRGQYDLIIQFGAVFSPGVALEQPLFVFTDSCRWLSSRNTHDEVSHFRSPADEARWLALEGAVYRAASRVFVGTEFVRRALVEHYHVGERQVVLSGFGAEAEFGNCYEKVFDGRTIVYIGKGDFQKKGGILLIQAFEHVRREIPTAVLHIVGQDSLPPAPGVVNHGFMRDRHRIVELMRSAHVFALPSLVDRNPISILEAMATATPCVASDYGAMPELVGDAGLIAPCNDVDALTRTLLTILRDHELARRLGTAGRRRFEEKYNWDTVWQIVRSEMLSAIASKQAAA
jgi:glycosyltransferase involved in cell wall biosynthesis